MPNTPAFRRPGNRTGTLDYMAPELLRREPIDERIDVFAFGVLAFEFLTGRLPYDATNPTAMMLQRINSEPLDAAVVKPVLSDELCAILRQLTARQQRAALADHENVARSTAWRSRQAPAVRHTARGVSGDVGEGRARLRPCLHWHSARQEAPRDVSNQPAHGITNA